MKKRNIILQTAVVSALALMGAQSAYASALANAGVSTFATEAIPASGAITINGGITYTTSAKTASSADTGLLTFTLPAGVTFATTPTLTGDGTVVTSATVGGGGAGQNTLTVNVGIASVAGVSTGTVALGSFQVTGATALSTATATGAFQLQAQGSGFVARTELNDATVGAAQKADLALSGTQLAIGTTTQAATIDVNSPSNGNLYLTTTSGTTRSAYLGSVTVTNNANRNAANTAAYAFTETTGTAILTGDWTGVSSIYAVTPAATCANTVPSGAKVATVAGSAATITGLTVGSAYGVCVINNSTTLLRESSTIGTSVKQDSSTKTAAAGSTLGGITYNGTAVLLNYVVGDSAAYKSVVRVNNNNAAAARVIVSVKKDDGTVSSGLLDASLAANNSKLYFASDINTAVGSTVLGADTDRAQVTILSPNTITAKNLLLNMNNNQVVEMP